MTIVTTYDSLLLAHRPRPIRSRAGYVRMLEQVDRLMSKSRLSAAERDLVELLSVLVAQHESHESSLPTASPAQMLTHLIDAHGITKAQLARETGIARSTLTNVANGHRGISKVNAVKLGEYFHVSPALFVEAGG